MNFPEIDPSTFFLEYQGHREHIWFSRTDHHGSVTLRLLENKPLTIALLQQEGFPVPEEILTDDIRAAEEFLKRHGRVVVKPVSNTGGIGITTDITTPEELARAFNRARTLSNVTDEQKRAIVQQHLAGEDCRVLVINQKHLFAIQRIAAHVVGDGQTTVNDLVTAWNATRKVECHIQLSELTDELLAKQHLTLDSVPAVAQRVLLAYVSNYHAGGRLRDVTDELGDDIRETALRAARYFNMPIVGVDFMTDDHTRTAGLIIELNGTPDITIHHFPDEGVARDVAGPVIDMLFPETAV